MCDECGCRELVPVSTLAEQHDLIDSAGYKANKYAKNFDYKMAGKLIVATAEVIIPHADAEEDNLFKVYADTEEMYKPVIEQMILQHRNIEKRLTRLALNQTCDVAWADGVSIVVRDISDHFNSEYNDLFKNRGYLPYDPRMQDAEDELNLIDLRPLKELLVA